MAERIAVIERQIDQAFVSQLVTQPAPNVELVKWQARLQRRQKYIGPFAGRSLVCAFVRLARIHYTIEIDPGSGSIVYWEAQDSGGDW